MTSTDPATVVVRYIDAVRDGDLDGVRGSFAPDASWDYPGDLPLSGTWRGPDAMQITSVREYTDTQHVEHVLFGGQ